MLGYWNRSDATAKAIRNAVRRHFASWRPEPEPRRTIPLDPAPARARRNSGPLCEIDYARSLSYAWGLLHQAGRGRVTQRQFAVAYAFLEHALTLAQDMHYPHGQARIHHAYATMHAVADRPQLARGHLQTALTMFEGLGASPEAARARQLLAQLGP